MKEGPAEYFSSRMTNKERKKTLVDELLVADDAFRYAMQVCMHACMARGWPNGSLPDSAKVARARYFGGIDRERRACGESVFASSRHFILIGCFSPVALRGMATKVPVMAGRGSMQAGRQLPDQAVCSGVCTKTDSPPLLGKSFALSLSQLLTSSTVRFRFPAPSWSSSGPTRRTSTDRSSQGRGRGARPPTTSRGARERAERSGSRNNPEKQRRVSPGRTSRGPAGVVW